MISPATRSGFAALVLAIAGVLSAQDKPTGQSSVKPSTAAPTAATAEEGSSSSWQPYFRQLAAEYRLTLGEATALKLVDDPLLKWNQPVRGGQDGAVFLWVDDNRPAVIGTFFIWPAAAGRQGVSHELHALAVGKLEGEWREKVRWRPQETEPVQWHLLADASAPSLSAAKRLIEARSLARRFAATSQDRQGQLFELRLLPRPFYHYDAAKTRDDWLGGCLFSLSQGTDTEIVLWLEARKSGDSTAWHYACARMSDLKLRVTLDGKEAWTAEFAKYDQFQHPYLCTAGEFLSEPPSTPSNTNRK